MACHMSFLRKLKTQRMPSRWRFRKRRSRSGRICVRYWPLRLTRLMRRILMMRSAIRSWKTGIRRLACTLRMFPIMWSQAVFSIKRRISVPHLCIWWIASCRCYPKNYQMVCVLYGQTKINWPFQPSSNSTKKGWSWRNGLVGPSSIRTVGLPTSKPKN